MSQNETHPSAISLTNVAFDWPGQRFGLVVDSFEVATGATVLLLGESGSGKSTLLSLITGVLSPSRGSVVIEGQDLSTLSSARRDRFRADTFGIIFQMFNLLPYATALDNILVPLHFSPNRRSRCKSGRGDALALTSALGLSEPDVVRGAASRLSVGQQQRVAVARAMIGRPPIVIADEPTSALDTDRQEEFITLVFDQVREAGSTLLMVTHDTGLAQYFDRVVTLNEIATVRNGTDP